MRYPVETAKEVMRSYPHDVMYAAVSGSDSYGFPSEASDIDVRGFHRLKLDELLGIFNLRDTAQLKKHHERYGLVEVETHEVGKYANLILRGNGTILEQLSSPFTVRTTYEAVCLQSLASSFVTKRTGMHYQGFARHEWKEVMTRPTVKKLLYTFRVILTGIHAMRSGKIEQNIDKLRDVVPFMFSTGDMSFLDDLLAIKRGGVETAGYYSRLEPIEAEYVRCQTSLEAHILNTKLPEDPPESAKRSLNEWVVMTRKGAA